MTKTTKKNTKRPTKKAPKTLFQRTTPKDVWRQNRLALTGAVLVAILGFAGFRYFNYQDASAALHDYCGTNVGKKPCWTLWADLGKTTSPEPYNVEMQGHACWQPYDLAGNPTPYTTNADGSKNIAAAGIAIRVWPTSLTPPGTPRYEQYAAVGSLDLVSNIAKSWDERKVRDYTTFFSTGSKISSDQLASQAILAPLNGGDGGYASVPKTTSTGKDVYITYLYRYQVGGVYNYKQSTPVLVSKVFTVDCDNPPKPAEDISWTSPVGGSTSVDASPTTIAKAKADSSSATKPRAKTNGTTSDKPKTNGTN